VLFRNARRGPHLRHGLHPDARGHNTQTLSQLGYNQLISQLNLGLGSAVSVLLFILVIIIAFHLRSRDPDRSRSGSRER